ncbi:response regulator transcription factor [Kribbella sp. NPDC058693]|uniref:response regulator transcription factor n=1 Tax=Kribbella sp. NPDC058693 TaxID=3346602 RepID=UPI00364B3B19
MRQTLRDVRILVADDQIEVARTLCEPLRSAGAAVQVVADGIQAYEAIRQGGFDLLVLDLKMPPDDWGGLWVMEQLRQAGLKVPVVVLSGEGGKQQTIQAMRLGAKEWIDKEDAFTDLLPRCTAVLEEANAEAFEGIAGSGPSPLAHRFARYRAASEERVAAEGLRVFEELIRFSALIGLATLDRRTAGPLRVTADQMARPSLGTWFNLLTALEPGREPRSPFSVLSRALMPQKSSTQRAREIIKIRNDVAHGGYEPSAADSAVLHAFLRAAAHRIGTIWPWQLGAVTSMEYDGTTFAVQVLRFIGLGEAQPAIARSETPARTASIVLVGVDQAAPIALDPWFQSHNGALCLFDGVKSQQRGLYDATAPLLFADPIAGTRGIEAAAWADISGCVAG